MHCFPSLTFLLVLILPFSGESIRLRRMRGYSVAAYSHPDIEEASRVCTDDNAGIIAAAKALGSNTTDCIGIAGLCNDAGYGETVGQYCPRTCGLCHDEGYDEETEEHDEDAIQKVSHWWNEAKNQDESSDEHQEEDDTDHIKAWELEDYQSHNDAEQEEEEDEEESEEEENEDNQPDDIGDSLILPSMLEGPKTRRRRSRTSWRRRRTSCVHSSRGGLTGGLPGTLPGGTKPMPRTPGCCKIGKCCMDCGAGGLGVCHMNAAKCGSPVCGGRFDASAVAPQCR